MDYLLAQGVAPDGGDGTGMTSLHWAANRGQLPVVEKLLRVGAALEVRNRFGGTVLEFAVWSVLHEPRPEQLAIIERLLAAGADRSRLPDNTGNASLDALLRRRGS